MSSEGAAGTVNADDFEEWVKEYLLPVLGNYEVGEQNSILVLDNASTHVSDHIVDMIKAKGTYVLFTAPYSADLNPIELGFNIYKESLKRNTSLFDRDWYSAHLHAIDALTSDISIEEFCRCNVPKSFQIMTSNEIKKVALVMNLL